jgi:HEAT repeat protein
MKRTQSNLALTAVLGTALLANCMASAPTAANSDDRATSIINDARAARNSDTRRQAVKALSLVGSVEPFASQLESMLDDKDVQVRIAVVEALSEQKTSRAIEGLQVALDDKVAEVRFTAAKALYKLNDEAGKQALIAALNGDSKTSSGLMAQIGREAKRTFESPSKTTVAGVKVGLALSGVPLAGPGFAVVEKAAFNQPESGRAVTAMLLANENDPAVTEALRSALSDKDPKTRAAAARALALQGNPSLKSDLIGLLEDKSQAVRVQAAASLLRLGSVLVSVTDGE